MTGNEFCTIKDVITLYNILGTIQSLLTPGKKRLCLWNFSTCLNKTLKMFEIILERDLVVHFLDAMMNLYVNSFSVIAQNTHGGIQKNGHATSSQRYGRCRAVEIRLCAYREMTIYHDSSFIKVLTVLGSLIKWLISHGLKMVCGN